MFPLETVRQYARSQGYAEVQYNEKSRVIGFVRDDQRVNVYYTTGDGYYRRVSAGRPEPSTSSGDGIYCCLDSNKLTNELVKGCNSETVVLALGQGYFAVQEDGDCWWSGIPVTLYNKVNGRLGGQPDRAAVDYVALGPDDQYYLQFRDGSSWWDGPDDLTEALRRSQNEGLDVDLLAFAPGDGWFVMYDDGSTEWQGLPTGLHNQINGRISSMPDGCDAATIEHLAVGPEGEWFVRYADGDCRYNNVPTEMQHAINKLQKQGEDLASMAFGENQTWAIRY